MSLLTDEEIRKWWASENGLEDCQLSKLDDFHKAIRAIEAAILAKLASAELPEPLCYRADCFDREIYVLEAQAALDAIRQAYAQGAAAQLSVAEKDAERYRWLRSSDTDVSLVIDKRTGWVPPDEHVEGVGGYHTYEYRAGEELDAAIDSAMEASK